MAAFAFTSFNNCFNDKLIRLRAFLELKKFQLNMKLFCSVFSEIISEYWKLPLAGEARIRVCDFQSAAIDANSCISLEMFSKAVLVQYLQQT